MSLLLVLFLIGCGTGTTPASPSQTTPLQTTPPPTAQSEYKERIDESVKFIESGVGPAVFFKPETATYMFQRYVKSDKLKAPSSKIDSPKIVTWAQFEGVVDQLYNVDPEGATYALDKTALAFLRQWFVDPKFSGKKVDRDLHDQMFERYCKRLGITNLNPLNLPE